MGFKKTILKNLGARVWFFVSIAIIVLLTVVTVLTTTVFYELLKTVIGGERRVVADGEQDAIYVSDHGSKSEALAAANALNVRVNEEGIVLLKNNGALPLAAGAKVHVFGKSSVNLVYGGSGSGAGDASGRKSLYESLTAAGIGYNAELKAFYDNTDRSGGLRPANPPIENSGNITLPISETPVASYGDLWNRIAADTQTQTALVVFSRIGGEGFDLPRKMGTAAGANADDHYLQLDNNERELLARVCGIESIKHVVVIINSSEAMELGFLDDPGHYAYNAKIDGALWIGAPGNSGIMALGRVLTGEVNPSGRLVDTYARDFTRDPSYVNFANNMVSERVGKFNITGDQYMKSQNSSYPYYFVDYEEGIYVGYRYYETRGFTEGAAAYSDDGIKGSTTSSWNSWYDAHVVYPFGYGMSYTSFEWTVKNLGSLNGATMTNKPFTVSVEVKNTGDIAGKDVVEIYATPYYKPYGIEKSHKVLCGFAKTPLLYPADEADEEHPNSWTLDIEIDPYDVASYDYNDANGNGFKGYELEAGGYNFAVSRSAHDSVIDLTLSVANDLRFDEGKVVNRYDDADDRLSDVTVNGQTRKGLSRSDFTGTFPTSSADRASRIVDDAFIAEFAKTDSRNPHVGEYTMPTQREGKARLRDLHGVDYEDAAWDSFMDKLDSDDMLDMVSNGNFQSHAILYVGKPATLESDGPVGFFNFMDEAGRYYDTCAYASECVMAATWNTELIHEVGRSIGNEGIWGNAKGDGTPYSGLYAPGVNIHRSPFGGRNFEYFSEDGFLSGMMASAEISGAREMGVYMYVKHFAVNDQETHRDSNGVSVWLTEQALREIYLKPFEKAVKVGKTTAVMSSFNRIGHVWAGGDYRLLTEILRDEWGFRGTVISDFNLSVYMNAKQMHYAGGDLNLTTLSSNHWNADFGNGADVYVLRRCAKNIMYTVANSCAVNQDVVGYRLPVWTVLIIVADVAAAVAIAVWGFFAVRKSLKKQKAAESEKPPVEEEKENEE